MKNHLGLSYPLKKNWDLKLVHGSGQIIATSAKVTPQCSLVGESLNSGLGII